MNLDSSEDALAEQPAIALFEALGWETANCFDEVFGVNARPVETLHATSLQVNLGRETPSEVMLVSRLLPALQRLNPQLPTVTSVAEKARCNN